MEQIAIISDIHGNLPALHAVLEDIERRHIKRTICLGDIIGKGPHPCQALDIIREKCEVILMGNWEHCAVFFDDDIAKWQRNALGEERINYIKSLPIYLEFFMSGQLIRVCHAAPHDVFYRVFPHSDHDKRAKLFEATKTLDQASDMVIYGDIHYAYTNHIDKQTVFNVGSVGNPMDLPIASYGILEGVYNSKHPAPFSFNFIRVPYDIEEAVRQASAIDDMQNREAYIKEVRTAIYSRHKKTNS